MIFPVRTVEAKDSAQAGKTNHESSVNRADAENAKARDDDSEDVFADHMNKDAGPNKKNAKAPENSTEERANTAAEPTKSQENAPEKATEHNGERAASTDVKTFAVVHVPVRPGKAAALEAETLPNTAPGVKAATGAATEAASESIIDNGKAQTPALAAPLQSAAQNVEAPKVSVANASAPVVKEVERNQAGLVKAAAAGLQGNAVPAENKPQITAPATQVSGALSAPDGIMLDDVLPVEAETLPKDLIKADLPGVRAAAAGKTAALTANSLVAGASAQAAMAPLSETALESSSQLFAQEGASSAKLVNVQPSQVATSAAQTSSAAVANTASAQLVAAIRTEPKSGDIELRLDPPEMGRVRISLSVETADAVKAVLTVERPETLEHLRRNMNQFTDDLRLAGFESIDVEFSEGGDTDFEDEPAWAGSEPGLAASAEAAPKDVIYLSLRDDAQLDLLV